MAIISAGQARGGEAVNQQAAAETVPEQVLVTGSLIRGAAAVGVPVTNLSPQDFAQTGALTTADLFKTLPAAIVAPIAGGQVGPSNIERSARVNLRGLDTGTAPRGLLMVDGVRVPPQGSGQCNTDPSIIPAIALERVDVLVDGASAVYGADAVSGVINLILRRGYEGAITRLQYTTAEGGKNRYMASQLWGRTWDGGDITLSYEWYDDSPIMANTRSKATLDYTPWGFDNRIPLLSSMPGTLSAGAANSTIGTACTNCLAIPARTGSPFNGINGGIGPLAPFSGSTLNWSVFNVAANSGANGTRNLVDTWAFAWLDSAQQRNAATITVDQRLTRNISFYGEAYYSNRRSEYLTQGNVFPFRSDLLAVAIPTINPYYPTGGAPTNLRVDYTLTFETPPITNAYELSTRYAAGLNIDLPGRWHGDIYFAETGQASSNMNLGSANVSAVSAALGWTLPATPASGNFPGIATWTKPSTVPYLNLFCDATAYQCNSPTTLNYIGGTRTAQEKLLFNEKGAKFDGPLFDLPGGEVKAAIGATYSTAHLSYLVYDSTASPTLLVPVLSAPDSRSAWAVFGQVNVPVFSEMNAIPFFNRLEVEGSWRHDQYSDFGGTSNPKVGFNWTPFDSFGMTIRGSWGTSFRAPSFSETSSLIGFQFTGNNLASFPTVTPSVLQASAQLGSVAYRLLFPAAGPAYAAGNTPGGISATGGTAVVAGLRGFGRNGGTKIGPEAATNWGIGFDFAPKDFLPGLDLQATYYLVKMTNTLNTFGGGTTASLNDATNGPSITIPTDLIDIDPACNNNKQPTACAPFQQMLNSLLSNPRNPIPASERANIIWIGDGGPVNSGGVKIDGIDWTASYVTDLENLGAWNVGVTGTYYLHNLVSPAPGLAPTDVYHQDILSVGGVKQNGVESLPRLRYRARLGWADGPWSVTGFMDYQSHYFSPQAAPPNVNFQCTVSGGTVGGGTLPCANTNYTDIVPSFYTFDLSLGYDTGDRPLNDYLKHVGIQLVIQNITDRQSPFVYKIAGVPGGALAFDPLKSIVGRTFILSVVKTW